MTPLHWALSTGAIDAVRYILEIIPGSDLIAED